MDVKSVIDKATPTIEKAGLKLVSSNQALYVYRHDDESVDMAIEIVHMPMANLSDLSSVLIRVSYSVKYGNFHENIRPENLLLLGEGRLSEVLCNSVNEVEETLNLFVCQAITTVIPYLYQVEYTAVAPTENLYRCLSEQIDLRCKTFIRTYGSNTDIPLEKVKEVETILSRLQPKDPWDRKDVFFNNQEMILNITAYLGQIILQYTDGHWTESSENRYEYFLLDPLGRVYDPLWNILRAWNFYPEVTTASLTSQLYSFFLRIQSKGWKDVGTVHPSD